MLELFGFAWVTITFTCCVAAVSTRRSVLRWLKARADRKRLDDTVEIVRRPLRRLATYAALVVLAVPAGVYAGGGALPGPSGGFGGGTIAAALHAVITAVASTAETIACFGVSDETASRVCHYNGSATDAVSQPTEHHHGTLSAAYATIDRYSTTVASDTGTTAVHVRQFGRAPNATSAPTAAISGRNLEDILNYTTLVRRLKADGSHQLGQVTVAHGTCDATLEGDWYYKRSVTGSAMCLCGVSGAGPTYAWIASSVQNGMTCP